MGRIALCLEERRRRRPRSRRSHAHQLCHCYRRCEAVAAPAEKRYGAVCVGMALGPDGV